MKRFIYLACAAILAVSGPSWSEDIATFERRDTTRVGNVRYTALSGAALKSRIDTDKTRLTDIEITSTMPLLFDAAAVKRKGPYRGKWWWHSGLSEAEVNAMWRDKSARLIDIEPYDTPAGLRFAVIMTDNTGPNRVAWRWSFGHTVASLKEEYRARQMKLVDIERYQDDGRTRFAAIMTDNTGAHQVGWAWYLAQTPAQINQKAAAQRMRVIDAEPGGTIGNITHDVILYRDQGPQPRSWHVYNVENADVTRLLRRHGARLIDIEPIGRTRATAVMIDNGLSRRGHCTGRLRHFADRLGAQMKRHAIPGAQVAVVKDGRLVFSCGLGVADLDRLDHVTPASLFRIMSISKPITAAAIRHLEGVGRYALTTSMIDALGDRAPDGPFADARMADVTIQNLLDHRTGLYRDTPYDPMVDQRQTQAETGRNRAMTCRQIMRHVIKTFPLNRDPGFTPADSDERTRAYSNVGYCILQQILAEHAPGTYQQIVKREILTPAGITAMRIGKGRKKDRAPGEVRHYDRPFAATVTSQYPQATKKVPLPYSYVIEAMAGHGGWLASANDLVRFAAFTPTRPYGSGAITHGGWLPGSRSRLQQIGDVYVAILTNGSPISLDSFDLSGLISQAVDDVDRWPRRDLWAAYGYPVQE